MRKEIIVSGLIISFALIVCTLIFKDAYINKWYPNTMQANLNADFSAISKAISYSSKDALTLYELEDYLGMYGPEKSGVLKSMLDSGTLEIPYTKIAGNIVFSKKAVDEWLYDSARSYKDYR